VTAVLAGLLAAPLVARFVMPTGEGLLVVPFEFVFAGVADAASSKASVLPHYGAEPARGLSAGVALWKGPYLRVLRVGVLAKP